MPNRAIRYAWFRIGLNDQRLWVIGVGPLRSAMKAADHSCFATVFDADIAAIPLRTTGGPLPGSHCSVIAILYPGDLLKAEGQVCRTSIRHIDPQTGKLVHRNEAVRVLKLFRTAVLAELGRLGRKWDGAPPSQAVVEDRLADCDHPIRDKVPGTVSDGHVGTGMLAATSFGWVAKQIDMLTGEKGRSGVSIKNIKTKGLRALRDNMVEYICKRIAEKRSAAPTSQAVDPADSAIDDDGAERQTAPQAAVVAQHQGTARVSAEGGNDGGKEKDEVGVEATTEKGQEEAACEGSGKVPVDVGEGANITGVQETGEASGRQGPELDDVEELRRENWLLRAENARLATLLDEEKARLDRLFVGVRGLVDKVDQVADSDQTAAERLRNATSAMSMTITGNITGSFDEA
ncbi:unnamed protein product [Closterium sp. Yama58-4]|nr:unnamed protein product [Closterium sp. Yama58-4]